MSPIVVDPVHGAGITPIVLDPSEVAEDRVELALNDGPIRVGQAGPDWGDAQIQAYMADLAVGSAPVDYRLPNRQIKVPLTLGADGRLGFEAARASLQSKVALFQRDGGWIKRDSGLYADLVNATLTMPDQWGHLGLESDVVLVLEALPDFYGDELTLGTHSSSTGELVLTETAVEGDHPGRLRIIVTEQSGNDQLGVLYGIRSRHYDSAPTAALVYEAEALTPLDLALVATNADASGGQSMKHPSLGASWTPVLSTNLLAGSWLTHTGSYRLWARVTSNAAVAPSLRCLWDVGDFTAPTENDAVSVTADSNWYLLDLGEIRLDPAPTGTHRWKGVIQAKGASGGESIWIDKLYLQPVDEAAGRIVATIDPGQGLAVSSARDEFNQTAGNLVGKTLPVGGTWSGAGSAGDFTVDSGAHQALRATTSDVSARFAIAGTTVLTNSAAQVDFTYSDSPHAGGPTNLSQGLALRYIDTSNYVFAASQQALTSLGNPYAQITVAMVIGGGGTFLKLLPVSVAAYGPGQSYTLRFAVFANGVFALWLYAAGAVPRDPIVKGYHAALASGGALASGKVTIQDFNGSPTAITRTYDNFAAWVPTPVAALYASRHAELRSDGAIRESSDGGSYGPLVPVGDLPRIPPSGEEGRTVEVLVKTTRGDFGQLSDTALDPIGVRLGYRPAWLFRPSES